MTVTHRARGAGPGLSAPPDASDLYIKMEDVNAPRQPVSVSPWWLVVVENPPEIKAHKLERTSTAPFVLMQYLLQLTT